MNLLYLLYNILNGVFMKTRKLVMQLKAALPDEKIDEVSIQEFIGYEVYSDIQTGRKVFQCTTADGLEMSIDLNYLNGEVIVNETTSEFQMRMHLSKLESKECIYQIANNRIILKTHTILIVFLDQEVELKYELYDETDTSIISTNHLYIRIKEELA